jgi:hypothetical protein
MMTSHCVERATANVLRPYAGEPVHWTASAHQGNRSTQQEFNINEYMGKNAASMNIWGMHWATLCTVRVT